MFYKRYYYLIKIQYLGYRYHGWQKQPKLKTVQFMIDRTLKFIFEGASFKTLGAGRTDAMVSANDAAFELFTYHDIRDLDTFLKLFNFNLPQDIRALSVEQVDEQFNVIQHSKEKEYHYVFSEGSKNHPFCAPILTTILEPLNVDIMRQGAKLFKGTHDFKSYCFRATNEGEYTRTILESEIIDNQLYVANFFPKNTYVFRVRGKGFMRNQIRLMFGTLIKLGRGEVDLNYVSYSLTKECTEPMDYIAPASGLILHSVDFE